MRNLKDEFNLAGIDYEKLEFKEYSRAVVLEFRHFDNINERIILSYPKYIGINKQIKNKEDFLNTCFNKSFSENFIHEIKNQFV